jgi:hypothetical protein
MEGRDAPTERALISVADLQRWEDHGASWRVLSVADDGAVIELCTCYGEAVDVVRGEGSELVRFVRERAVGQRES